MQIDFSIRRGLLPPGQFSPKIPIGLCNPIARFGGDVDRAIYTFSKKMHDALGFWNDRDFAEWAFVLALSVFKPDAEASRSLTSARGRHHHRDGRPDGRMPQRHVRVRLPTKETTKAACL